MFLSSEEQQARQRRSGDRLAALEIMLAGIVLPPLYVLSTVMMFNDFKRLPTILVATCSAACIGVAIWMLVRSR